MPHRTPNGYPFLGELCECNAQQLSFEAAQPNLDPEMFGKVENEMIILGVLDLVTHEWRPRSPARKAFHSTLIGYLGTSVLR